MNPISFTGILAALPVSILMVALAGAQDRRPPTQDMIPPGQQNCSTEIDPTDRSIGDTQGQGGANLSEKLSRSDGVICPPQSVDWNIVTPPPGGGRTPVIPPPGRLDRDPSATNPERIPVGLNPGCALNLSIGACPFRKTGLHFSGTCASSTSEPRYETLLQRALSKHTTHTCPVESALAHSARRRGRIDLALRKVARAELARRVAHRQ